MGRLFPCRAGKAPKACVRYLASRIPPERIVDEWAREDFEEIQVTLAKSVTMAFFPEIRKSEIRQIPGSRSESQGISAEVSPKDAEVKAYPEDLYEEDAPLVCWAILHLAVQKTNAFQFSETQKLVSDFSAIGCLLSKEPPFTCFAKPAIIAPGRPNYLPAAIPGLRYYGQLLSSCGQHEAFLGNQENAIIYFQEAIKCFEHLSENKFLDIDQTTAYYATAQMDLNPDSEETKAIMERYLGGNIIDAAQTLATSTEDKDKYHHHILLRYLVHSSNLPAREAYLAEKEKWDTGEGHPWEMIEFYRALLLEDDATDCMLHLNMAYKLALQGGPPLLIIACVFLGATRYYHNTNVQDKLIATIDQTCAQLPALGQQRIDALRNQISNPIPPLELAKIVLPFNFR